MANVPRILRENPAFIESLPIDKEAREKAEKMVKEHQEYLKFQKKKR